MTKTEWISKMVKLIHLMILARKRKDFKFMWKCFDGLVRATKHVGQLEDDPRDAFIKARVREEVESILMDSHLDHLDPHNNFVLDEREKD